MENIVKTVDGKKMYHVVMPFLENKVTRMKEGETGEEIVKQYRERQVLLENVKYLGLHM